MTKRDPLATLPASVRAINPTLARSTARATGRTAKRNGDAFEREVFAALATLQRVGVLAWWSHTSPDSKRLRDGRTITTGRALCDVVGCTSDGRAFVAEVKTSTRRIELSEARIKGKTKKLGGVQDHQRAQLDATAAAQGVALLIGRVGDVTVVARWSEVRGLAAITAPTARSREASSLSVGIIGAMVPRGPVEASGTPAAGVVDTSGRPEATEGAAGAVARKRRGA